MFLFKNRVSEEKNPSFDKKSYFFKIKIRVFGSKHCVFDQTSNDFSKFNVFFQKPIQLNPKKPKLMCHGF